MIIKEIWQDIQSIKSTSKQLREFGVVMGIFFGVISFLLHRKGGHFEIPAVVALIFLILGIAAPKALLPLQKIWMGIAVVIGFFMSRVLLFAIFFLFISPISLIARLTGKKFLNDHKDSDASYWITHPKISDKNSYKNQY